MALTAIRFLLLPASLWTLVIATPSPSVYSNANVAFPQKPVITASPVENLPTRTSKHKRDLFSSIESGIGSILSGLGSDIPSFVASGIPNFFVCQSNLFLPSVLNKCSYSTVRIGH